LEGLQHAKPISRSEGEKLLSDPFATFENSKWDAKRKKWKPLNITIKIIVHNLTADHTRMFGSEFYNSIFGSDKLTLTGIRLRDNRTLSYASGKKSGKAPVLQYLLIGKKFIVAIRIETCDLMLPFNSASLDKHSQTFLGLGKAKDLSINDKKQMETTFKNKTAETYNYAAVDALNTLLIYEQMKLRDLEIHESFKVPVECRPDFKGTSGRRGSDFLVTTASLHAEGSSYLNKKSKLKRLLKRGGFAPFLVRNSASRYGEQTAKVYGGLLMSRSPTQFWHEASGMFRDVDMSGCYNHIIGNINLYLGKPLVLEPGSKSMPLSEAVVFLEKESPDDGWFEYPQDW